jgi:hypothetical protein
MTSVRGHGNICLPDTARWKIDPTSAGASEIFFIIPFLSVSGIGKGDLPDHLVYTWYTSDQRLGVSYVLNKGLADLQA